LIDPLPSAVDFVVQNILVHLVHLSLLIPADG
jgi:hypothetical protein